MVVPDLVYTIDDERAVELDHVGVVLAVLVSGAVATYDNILSHLPLRFPDCRNTRGRLAIREEFSSRMNVQVKRSAERWDSIGSDGDQFASPVAMCDITFKAIFVI